MRYTNIVTYPPRSPLLYDLFKQGKLRQLRKGEAVFSTAEKTDVAFVFQGYVKRYLISNSGNLGVQIIYGDEDIFSLTNIYRQLFGLNIYEGRETYYYKAMSDTQVYMLSAETFIHAVGENLALYQELFTEAGYHLKTCVHNLENVSLASAYARLAHQLLFFARQFGEETPNGVRLRLRLTHQDIADMLMMARETVSKTLMQFREKGIIETTPDIIIHDMAALEDEAYA